MEINGSGGSFVQKTYPMTKALAWELGLLVLAEMEVTITNRNDAEYLLEGTILSEDKHLLWGTPLAKLVTFAVAQDEVEDEVQVIVDIRKKQIEVYSFKPQNKETNRFFQLFEEKFKGK